MRENTSGDGDGRVAIIPENRHTGWQKVFHVDYGSE